MLKGFNMNWLYGPLAALFLSLSLSCSLIYREMSPEQIKAIRETGGDVITCTILGGPPPAGQTVFIVIPKGSRGKISISPDCRPTITDLQFGGG